MGRGGPEGFRGLSARGPNSSWPVRSASWPKVVVPTSPGRSTESGPGVLELTLHHRGDAFRVVCAVRIGADVWVIHAFQEKSGTGVGTP